MAGDYLTGSIAEQLKRDANEYTEKGLAVPVDTPPLLPGANMHSIN